MGTGEGLLWPKAPPFLPHGLYRQTELHSKEDTRSVAASAGFLVSEGSCCTCQVILVPRGQSPKPTFPSQISDSIILGNATLGGTGRAPPHAQVYLLETWLSPVLPRHVRLETSVCEAETANPVRVNPGR